MSRSLPFKSLPFAGTDARNPLPFCHRPRHVTPLLGLKPGSTHNQTFPTAIVEHPLQLWTNAPDSERDRLCYTEETTHLGALDVLPNPRGILSRRP